MALAAVAAMRWIARQRLAWRVDREIDLDAAYKAIMRLSMVALQAKGHRTLTSTPGHHQTAIQTLTTSVGVAPTPVIGVVVRSRAVGDQVREALMPLEDAQQVRIALTALTAKEPAALPEDDPWWANVVREGRVLKGAAPDQARWQPTKAVACVASDGPCGSLNGG